MSQNEPLRMGFGCVESCDTQFHRDLKPSRRGFSFLGRAGRVSNEPNRGCCQDNRYHVRDRCWIIRCKSETVVGAGLTCRHGGYESNMQVCLLAGVIFSSYTFLHGVGGVFRVIPPRGGYNGEKKWAQRSKRRKKNIRRSWLWQRWTY
jgi:hypothetical protein